MNLNFEGVTRVDEVMEFVMEFGTRCAAHGQPDLADADGVRRAVEQLLTSHTADLHAEMAHLRKGVRYERGSAQRAFSSRREALPRSCSLQLRSRREWVRGRFLVALALAALLALGTLQ